MWSFDTGLTPDGPTVKFTILDPDGTEGYPRRFESLGAVHPDPDQHAEDSVLRDD